MRLSIKYGPFSTDRKASRFYDKLVEHLQSHDADCELRSVRMSADCRSITVKTKKTSIDHIPFAEEVPVSIRIHISECLELTATQRRGIVIFNHNFTLAKPYVVRFPEENDGETASFVFKTSCYEVSLTVGNDGSASYDIKHHVLRDLDENGFAIETEVFQEGEFKHLSDLETITHAHKDMLQLAYNKCFVQHQPVAFLPRT